jgi:fructose-1,6-bisphosphatase I
MSTKRLITIERHIQEQQKSHPSATGTFTSMLQDMALAAKLIAREINRAGLTGLLGEVDTINPSGERQQKLDMFADEMIFKMNDHTGRVCAMASEEHDDLIDVPVEYDTGNYVLLYDPLDGSSNLDVNVSVGTIFSIHRKFSRGERGMLEDVLQRGKRLVAAGYVVYGSSTMMVYTTGNGVYGFTLDLGLGEFLLTHDNLRFPETAQYYSINQGNEKYWTPGVRRYVKWLQGIEGEGHKPLAHRYIGSLVADFHRNLLKGGIFMYPGDLADKDKPYGKIRLMFEAQALAFIAEQAGGYGSDGMGDLLELRPHSLHQRVPIFVGSRDLVERAEDYIRKYDPDWQESYKPYRTQEAMLK